MAISYRCSDRWRSSWVIRLTADKLPRDVLAPDAVTFGTTTRDLLALSDWLGQHECTHVAMEATRAGKADVKAENAAANGGKGTHYSPSHGDPDPGFPE